MTKRVLFTATLVKGHVAKFHVPYLKWFKEHGWETWVAAKNDYDAECHIPYCDHFIDIPFTRSPFSWSTLKAYSSLKRLLDREHFDLIHTHTPVASVLTRLAACKVRRQGTKLFYTAHGFHFSSGGHLINWLLWFPVELIMSRHADLLITINSEDFQRAQRFARCDCRRMHGVGVDFSRFPLGQADWPPRSARVRTLLAIGDLNKNKNHSLLIRTLPLLGEDWRLQIAGDGPLKQSLLQEASDLGVAHKVEFLGYRYDVPRLLAECDVFALPSFREGLPVSLIEAAASGKPCVASDIRGSREVLGAYPRMLMKRHDPQDYAKAIEMLSAECACDPDFAKAMRESVDAFRIENVLEEYAAICRDYLEGFEADGS